MKEHEVTGASASRPGMTARLREFASAVSNMPWVATRLAAGQQFNVYESADNDEYDDPCDWNYALCLGPITDHNFICPIVGQDRAQLIEAAMKVATEALREHDARDRDGSPKGGDACGSVACDDSAGRSEAEVSPNNHPHPIED